MRRRNVNPFDAAELAIGVLLILTVALLIFTAPRAEAYEYYPGEPAWPDAPIYWHYDSSCPGYVHPEIIPAFTAWGVRTPQFAGPSMVGGYDGLSTIYCSVVSEQALSLLPADVGYAVDSAAMAKAYVYWSKSRGIMLECDIQLDTTQTTAENIRYILRHEIGHCLGLAHSAEPDALMWPYIKSDIGLNVDDIGGMSRLYGMCESVADAAGNTFLDRVAFEGKNWSGFVPAGGVWPGDVYSVQETSCE